jgi:hypothetical protein
MSRPISRLLLALAALVSAGCCSVSYGAAGYERHGAWPGGGGRQAYRPAATLSVQGHQLRFDPTLRLYRVMDEPGHFYSAGRFYRGSGTTWETARSLDGPWSPVAGTQVPPLLLKSIEPEEPE